MFGVLRDLFSAKGFMPHGHCYLWQPGLIWLHVLSDAVTTLAYITIPVILIYLARRRRDVRFHWMFIAFGLFIIACGATHALEIWTLWTPMYWLSGTVKAITALASAVTAVLLVRLLPIAVAIPTSRQLALAHDQLREANEQLERRVAQRTAELTRSNAALARQIAEAARTSEALARSERRYRQLVDSGVIGVVAVNEAGVVREANAAVLAMIGYTAEDVRSGQIRWTELTPPEYRALDELAIQRMRATGAAQAWEKEYIRKDGSRVAVLVGAAALDDTASERIAFVLDLTERNRTNDALRRLRTQRDAGAKMAALLDAAPDAMVIVDDRGRIALVNAEAEALFGYPRDQLIEQPIERLVPTRLHGVHGAHREAYARNPMQRRMMARGGELRAVRADGTEFPAEICLGPVHTDDGLVFVTAIRDITARKQAERVLRTAKETAEAANSELEAFSYSVAHDLRAPLRSMNVYSNALLEDVGDRLGAEGAAYVARIAQSAVRMDEIIDALLSLARLTRTSAQRAPVDLSEVARDVIDRLRAAEPARLVRFVATDGLVVQGDPLLLRVLLDNLLGNAWKFTGKQAAPCIELGREERDGEPVYYVRDNGAGFDMALVDKLFAPFRRLHSQAEFEGTGIGLATVQRIVRRHGGRVWAEGARSLGAAFRFTIPDLATAGAPS